MSTFSSTNRENTIQKLSAGKFDLLIIGGGITGAGILLDAQTRGMNVALIEMQDFASGTSSRSTKLIHGGLRYLKQLELKLVAEVGRERAIVYKNGRHVTRAEAMVLPLFKNGSLGYFAAYFGLWLYDFLAGVKKDERRRMLTSKELLAMEPLLKKEALTGGALYYEYRTDDARLTIEILKMAVSNGATAANYLKAKEFLYDHGQVCGIVAEDQLTGSLHTINATQLVNATGPWVDTLDVLNDKSKGEKLFLTKGVHLVFDREKLPIKHSVYFDTDDKRMIFAIPRGNKVYAGTTDTAYQGSIASPIATSEDKKYILQALNAIFPSAKLAAEDVESSWAGLRPLIREKGKSPSAVSRKDEIFQYSSGLMSIAGGKLTGYRKMAERIVNLVSNSLGKNNGKQFSACRTKNIRISGGDFDSQEAFEAYQKKIVLDAEVAGLTATEYSFLAEHYGSNAHQVLGIYGQMKETNESYLPPFIRALIVYSIQAENAFTLTDFFIRRTGALYFNIAWVRQWKSGAADFMARMLDWTEIQKTKFIQELEEALSVAAA